MDLLGKVEHLLGEVIERAFRSSGRFTPLDLDRALRQELDRSTRKVLGRVFAPNRALILLSPGDHDEHQTLLDEIREQVTRSVVRHADHRGWTLLSPFELSFERDERLERGAYRFRLRFERGPEPAPEPAGPAARISVTVRAADGSRETAQLGGRPSWVIGRDPGCDLVLDDSRVSARHARIHWDGEAWAVEDLGSTNGLEVNGRRTTAGPLAVGDTLALGRIEIVLESAKNP